MKPTVYDTITNEIVAAIEAGAATCRMPWHRSRHDVANPSSIESGKSYRGVNILTLWMIAEARGYTSGLWATYRQWQQIGAQVRKGETAAPVMFWKPLQARDAEDAHDPERRGRFVARGYSVFNADQVDGYEAGELPLLPESERIAAAERFFANIPAAVTHGGNSAYYVPTADRIQMVPFGQFERATAYYATLAHELTHWTGAKPRLDRDLSGRFGSESYAMEELVAELGAAFTMGRLDLATSPRDDHAPYIANWLRVLKNDSRAIFIAASQAQRAADYFAAFLAPPG